MLNTLQLLFIEVVFVDIVDAMSQKCRDKVNILNYLFEAYSMIAKPDIIQIITQMCT